jgi:hypothetical protein
MFGTSAQGEFPLPITLPITIIADNLSKAGGSLGWVSALDRQGCTSWIADAHHGDGKRFVVRADEILTAFLELESATRGADGISGETLHNN